MVVNHDIVRKRRRRRSADCVYDCLNFIPKLEDLAVREFFKKSPPFCGPWRSLGARWEPVERHDLRKEDADKPWKTMRIVKGVGIYDIIAVLRNGTLNQVILSNLESRHQALQFVEHSLYFKKSDVTDAVLDHLQAVESTLEDW